MVGVVDLYPEESHRLPITKTKYPVEDGSSRTDNSVVAPESLVLRGFVSDLQPFAGGFVSIADEGRPKEAWGRIRALKNARELVTVVTTLGIYENMLITDIDASVSARSGRGLSFTINMEETLITSTELVSIPPTVVSGPAETKASDTVTGDKQSEVPEDSTLLRDVVKSIGGFFG